MKRATDDRSRRKTARRRRPRLDRRVLVAAIVALLALLWVVYWYGASQIGAAVLDRVAAAASARGYTATCDDISGGGFPWSVDLSCNRASLSGATGAEATVGGFSATTVLYRPWSIRSEAAGPLDLSLPASAFNVTANWQKAETRIDASFGGLSAVAANIEGLRLDLPSGTGLPPFDGLNLTRSEVIVSPASGDDYSVSVVAHGIGLEVENRSDLPEIDLDADLRALDFGDSLGLDPREALRAWIAGGGGLRIDSLTIAADTVSAEAGGALAVSADGKLSGDLEVTIAGVETLPALVETFYPAARDQTAQIVAAVTAFTRPVDTPSGPARQMTLLIRDSVVSVGILPIGVVPPIAF